MPILLKLYRCFCHDLKICMWFGYYPEIIFCHFFCNLNLVIFKCTIMAGDINSLNLLVSYECPIWCTFIIAFCILMDFPKHIGTVSMGLAIVYSKGSQVEFSKSWCFSVP